MGSVGGLGHNSKRVASLHVLLTSLRGIVGACMYMVRTANTWAVEHICKRFNSCHLVTFAISNLAMMHKLEAPTQTYKQERTNKNHHHPHDHSSSQTYPNNIRRYKDILNMILTSHKLFLLYFPPYFVYKSYYLCIFTQTHPFSVIMVNTNYYIENKLSIPQLRSLNHSNKWHQSQNPGRNIQRSQTEFVQRQIKRDTEIAMGNKMRQISKECKDMLKKKMEEIRVHNENLAQKKGMVGRYKNYICFKCKLKGHIAKYCPTDGKTLMSTSPEQNKHKEEKIQIMYPETVHITTDYMVEGTDEHNWNMIWYVSDKLSRHMCSNLSLFSKIKEKFSVEKDEEQKKFIFIHGIGEVQIRIGNDILIIPSVNYAPEVTLNVLSVSQLEAQGLVLSYKGNRCRPIPMFKYPTDCVFNENKMNQRHNEYLEGYFNMVYEGSQIKKDHKEKAVSFSPTCNICEEIGHLDYMCPQNSFTSEDKDFVFTKGVHIPIPIKCFNDCIALLNLLEDDYIISQNWNEYRENFMKAYLWFYSVYLKRSLPGPLPPKIKGKEIHLMDLHKRIETLGGYLGVDFANKFSYIAQIFGLDEEDGQRIKECYNLYLNVFICFYKTARVSHEEAEGIASKGKEICQEDQEDQVTENSALDIQNKKKVEHFGVKLEDTMDTSQKHIHNIYEEGQSSKV
ncbi:ARID DNA-binding domain-containing protein [Artemisia annua]|uniref:ARID DNA-binding domain-containing protein n=1 Tax=Artemisia annua TaxID=35608 RepID=A0A2U1QFB2_ARTAN|nr:ARID DNA-binding domain-containing protein [Artemisia annua]